MKNDLQGVRVLLAEDSQDIQLVLCYFLRKAGALVDTALNGEEALVKAKDSPYGVILMDLQMPILNGFEAVKCLRSAGYSGSVLALTASDVIAEKEHCLTIGFDAILSKSLAPSDLIREILNFYKT